MDNFYDLNDFLVFLIKKWKVAFAILIVVIIAFSGGRAVSLYSEYRSQPTKQEVASDSATSEEPVWCKVQQLIQVRPLYEVVNGQNVDVTYRVIEAFRNLSLSDQVMNTMYDKWYADEKEEYASRVKKLQQYGYILDKEASYPYARVDFYNQFLIEGQDITALAKQVEIDAANCSFATLGFKSTSKELAQKVSADYASEVIKMIQEKVGPFEYEIVDESVLYELPTRSEGTQTTRTVSASAGTQITMSYIVKQVIKGMVWGAILGIVLSIVVVFAMYMMTRKVFVLADLKKYEIPVLGIGFSKKGALNKLFAKVYRSLEGGNWDTTKKNEKLVKKICDLYEEEVAVMVTGSSEWKGAEEFVEKLNKHSTHTQYYYGASINDSSKVKKYLEDENKNILIVEKFGLTLKDDVQLEVKRLKEQEANILGMVAFE